MKNEPTAIFIIAMINVSMVGLGVMLLMMAPKLWTFVYQDQIKLQLTASTDNNNMTNNMTNNNMTSKVRQGQSGGKSKNTAKQIIVVTRNSNTSDGIKY